MIGTSAWKKLSEGGNSRGIVLAVDFDTTGRPEARFADLVAGLDTDFEIRESVPPAHDAPGAPRTGEEYVEHWAREVEAEGARVHALMGFCGGSVYAASLAARIGAAQGAPPLLLLFDPEIYTAQTLIWQFHKVIGFMAGTISQEQVDEARAMGQRAYDEIARIVPLKDELMRLMWEFGEPALVSAGLDKARRDELFGVFDSYLCYLAAAAEIDPLEQWRSAVAFSSNSPLSGLNALRNSGVDVTVSKEVATDVDHGILLADKAMAAIVADLLNA